MRSARPPAPSSTRPPAARRARPPASRVPMALQQRLRLVCAEGEVVSRRCGRRLGGHQGGHGPVARDRCAPRGRALLGAGGAKRAQGPVAELHGHTWRRTSSSAAGHGGALELRGRPWWRRAGRGCRAGRFAPWRTSPSRPPSPSILLRRVAVPAGVPQRSRRDWRLAAEKELAGGSFFCTPPEMRVGREVAVSGGGACAR
jgi:hypothetical protein